MNWVADENVDRLIIEWLRARGEVVYSITDLAPSTSDQHVLELAERESAILLTADKGFGVHLRRGSDRPGGIILLRLAGLDSKAKVRVFSHAVEQFYSQLVGQFVVITPRLIRLRTLRQ